MKNKQWAVLFALVFMAAAVPGTAGIVGLPLSTSAPPSYLGSYSMQPFALDLANPIGDPTLTVALPVGAGPSGVVAFDTPLTHYTIGNGWDTWSHGYAGDVYWFDELVAGTSSVTLTLPTNTKAFYFYVEPNFFGSGTFDIAANLLPVFSGVSIDGRGGAAGFGFYSDDATSLTSITITGFGTWPDGFAIGEFGINAAPTGVPDGGLTGLLLASALLALLFVPRRFAR